MSVRVPYLPLVLTSMQWLHYLAVKLTQGKRLRAASSARERQSAKTLLEVERALASSIASATGKQKGVRKGLPAFKSVVDVMLWAEECALL